MKGICESKKFYDTEFEATIAAAKSEYKFEAEMVPYKCREGNHWHIGNKKKSLRGKHRNFKRTFCDPCQTYMKPGRYPKHITLIGHRNKVNQLDGLPRDTR